jgi:hypothetical protein
MLLLAFEHTCNELDVLRGAGADNVKSTELCAVSKHPLLARRIAMVLLGAGAAAVPSKQLAVLPYPTKSTMLESTGQAPERASIDLTSATLPEVAARDIEPLVSGPGRTAPLVPAELS